MVQLNLPANSKVEKGQYYKDKTGWCPYIHVYVYTRNIYIYLKYPFAPCVLSSIR
jgi:hypothetical protein